MRRSDTFWQIHVILMFFSSNVPFPTMLADYIVLGMDEIVLGTFDLLLSTQRRPYQPMTTAMKAPTIAAPM